MLVLAACNRETGTSEAKTAPALDPNFLADNTIWRNERSQQLLQPDGWTSLVGLHWLELKAHYLGSSPGSGIRLAGCMIAWSRNTGSRASIHRCSGGCSGG